LWNGYGNGTAIESRSQRNADSVGHNVMAGTVVMNLLIACRNVRLKIFKTGQARQLDCEQKQ